ncbi:MAG: hypothetical protein ACRCX8_06610 [Sarcina sp.]
MRTISDYKELLDEEIQNSKIDTTDIKKIVMKFINKGFNGLRIANLFNSDEGSVTVDKLAGYELAGVFTELYELTNKLEKYNPCDLPARAREEYEKGKVVIESDKNIFKIENMIQTSDNSYLGFWKLEDIYEARKEGKIRYNLDTQREATYVTTKQGKIKKEATINMKSVNEIADNLVNGTYGVPDMLTLNIPIYSGKDPNYNFEDGTLVVELNSDFDSDHFTMIDSIDGEHRQLAVVKAMMKAKKEGLTLIGGFPVTVTIQTIEQARNYVARLQKANPISINYTKVIESNDYTKIIDKINSSKGLLRGKIGKTYEDMKMIGGFTHSLVLIEAMKKLNIEVYSVAKRVTFEKVFKKVIEVLEENLKEDEFSKYREDYLSCNIFAGYVVIADYMIKNNKDDEWLLECFVAINLLLLEDQSKKLKLSYKSTSHLSIIIDVFKEICKKIV